MLSGFEDRSAVATSCIGSFNGEKFTCFSGSVNGQIVRKPRGISGFGWDPIFQPAGWEKTFAEMNSEEKNLVSMRKKAVLNLKDYLLSHKLKPD